MARFRKSCEYGGIMVIKVHLTEELRKIHKKRAFSVKKGDKVKILRGSFRGTVGKVISVNLKKNILKIDGVERTKADGSKVKAPIDASNTELIEIDASDKWRKKILKR